MRAYSIAWLILALPFVASLTIFLFTRRYLRLSAYVSIGATAVAWCLALAVFVMQLANPTTNGLPYELTWLSIQGFQPVAVGLLIDPLAAVMLMVVTTVSLLIQVYSLGYMKQPEYSRYYAEIALFTGSMLGLVLSNNFLQLYIFWELVGLCSYLLIGFYHEKKSAADAAKKAFVVTRFGDFGLLLGILFIAFFINPQALGMSSGSAFNFLDLAQAASAGQIPPWLVTTIALLVFCGASGKSAQFPLHVWLPDAMEGPSPVSALIHAATMVAAGVYLVARNFALFAASPDAMAVVAGIGGFTALFAATIAVAQNDIKRVLAYSTLSQLGYMMMALGMGGLTAGTFHLMTHAFFKALLFLGAGAVIHAVGTNDIWKMGGLWKDLRVTGVTFVIAALSLSGILPLSGFWSKDEILTVAWSSGHHLLFFVGLITAFLTAFYMFRLCFQVFGGKLPEGVHLHKPSRSMEIPLIVLAVLSVCAGWVGIPGTHGYESFVATPNEEGHFSLLIAFVSTLVALAGIWLAWQIYGLKRWDSRAIRMRHPIVHSLLERKYYIDEIYTFVIRYTLFVLARIVALFDRNVVDGTVNVVAWTTQVSGHGLRRAQTGKFQHYALYICLGMIALMVVLALLPTGGAGMGGGQ